MRTGREEALDLMHKWLSEGAFLQCNFEFLRLAAAFRGRIRAISPDRLEFWSDDKRSELVLSLGPDVEFGSIWLYGEPKAFSDEAEQSVCGLVIFLPPHGPDGNMIAFTEVVDGG